MCPPGFAGLCGFASTWKCLWAEWVPCRFDALFVIESQRWLQGGKTEAMYVGMYSRAMDEMMSKLIRKTRPSGLEVSAGLGHAGDPWLTAPLFT